ncbi:MAG TPA: hypothetical protein VII08_14895 [Myxococcales bacterium]
MPKKRLLRCRACRLKWFPQGDAGAPCPACGSSEVGTALQLFHVGIALIALALIGWAAPLIGQRYPEVPFIGQRYPRTPSSGARSAGERPVAMLGPLVEAKKPPLEVQRTRPVATISAVIKAKKLTVDVQRGPAEGHKVTLRRGDKVTILERRDRRFLVRDRRGNQVYVPFDKVNARQKTKTRSQHVQR